MQEWELGRRFMQEYVLHLIAYKVLNEKRKGHSMMRLIKVLIALPMIMLFGILRAMINVVSYLYCHAASLVLILLVICLILAVITPQWF